MAWKEAPIDVPEFVRKQLFMMRKLTGISPVAQAGIIVDYMILTVYSVLKYAKVYLALFMTDSKARPKIIRSTLSVVVRTTWAKMEKTIDFQVSEAPMNGPFDKIG